MVAVTQSDMNRENSKETDENGFHGQVRSERAMKGDPSDLQGVATIDSEEAAYISWSDNNRIFERDMNIENMKGSEEKVSHSQTKSHRSSASAVASIGHKKKVSIPRNVSKNSFNDYDLSYLLDGMRISAQDSGFLLPKQLLTIIAKTGLSLNDERIGSEVQALLSLDPGSRLPIKEIVALTRTNILLQLALSGQLVVRDFEQVSRILDRCYDDVYANLLPIGIQTMPCASSQFKALSGAVATAHGPTFVGETCKNTPKLASIDPGKIAASFCSIQGQKWSRGNSNETFTVQEACGPLIYLMALRERGDKFVHRHVGQEAAPSITGSAERTVLDSFSRPFNPFTEAGLIQTGALLLGMDKEDKDPSFSYPGGTAQLLSDRCESVKKLWGDSIGRSNVGFSNSFYLSQRTKSNRAFSLAYMMNAKRGFPGGERTNEELMDILYFFFINCSIEVGCEELATFAGTLAAGGVCPTTGLRVFQADEVTSCLSLMSSCGMGDYSGRLQFTIGYPCKSSCSGFTMIVIPNLGGFCSFSPLINQHSISVFGLQFMESLVENLPLHYFDPLVHNTVLPNRSRADTLSSGKGESNTTDNADGIEIVNNRLDMLTASAYGRLATIRQLYARGVDVCVTDYDMRTPLHLAASNGKLACVKLLCALGASLSAVDRNGNTPLDDAVAEEHEDVALWLEHPPPFVVGAAMTEAASIFASPLKEKSIPEVSRSGFDEEGSGECEQIGKESFASIESGDNFDESSLQIDNDEVFADDQSLTDRGQMHHCRAILEAELRAKDILGEHHESYKRRDARSAFESADTSQDPALEKVIPTSSLDPGPENLSIDSTTYERIMRWKNSLKYVKYVGGNENGESDCIGDATFGALLRAVEHCGIHDIALKNDVYILASGLYSNKPHIEPEKETAVGKSLLGMSVTKIDSSKRANFASFGLVGDDLNSCSLTVSDLCKLWKDHPIIQKVLEGDVVIRNFPGFTRDMKQIFEKAKIRQDGATAKYIPQLARVNPEKFGAGICSVDGQRFSVGDSKTQFCLQSTMKPINYCIAQELIGAENVHRHVGCEPSGLNFNELILNESGLPHNPLINAGAIATASLIMPSSSLADRFDYVTSVWQRLSGGEKPGYSVETSLGELGTADRNFCLGYLMKEKGVFGEHVKTSSDLRDVLEFYFSCCALELNCESMAVVAATLANRGINPITQERCFAEETVRNCLCIMSSSGMYDFSGQFQYLIGVPAKSGVSGALMVVVPNVMGICIWSPRLDSLGNSTRGLEFCRILQERYAIHRYSLMRGISERQDIRDWSSTIADERRAQRLIEATTCGDDRLFKLLLSEWTKRKNAILGANNDRGVNCADYDLRRPIHLAASEGRLKFVEMLHDAGADLSPFDRWGNTPLSEATRYGHHDVVKYLEQYGAVLGDGKRGIMK